MAILTIQRNVQFLYEDHLARVELGAFGCHDPVRDASDPWRLEGHVNGHLSDLHERAAYIGAVDGRPTVYEQLIKPNYQGGEYNRTRSVNQYLTHWIYPYRGKFHPQMVRALFNIIGVGPGSKVLEPFLGSGTAALEAQLLGADCIGVDRSPVCVLVSRVKTQAYAVAAEIRARVTELLANRYLKPSDIHPDAEPDERVGDFLRVALLVTSSDTARRERDADKWLRKNLERMVTSVEDQARAVVKFGIRAGAVTAVQGDSRNLRLAHVEDESIDGIVTSPPYSVALDYVKNDEHSLRDLKVNLTELRAEMIGVRGEDPRRKHAAYNADMQAVFAEVARVMKPGARAAFVVGDATIGGEEVTTTTEMSDWAAQVGLRQERNLRKIVFGLYNVMTDEKILIYCKE